MKLIKFLKASRHLYLYRMFVGICLLYSVSSLCAQDITVSGVITDTNGEAIIGANVTVQGTTKGVISDINGKFSLKAPSKGVLRISYVGYHTQDIAIKSRTHLKIELIEDAKALDEVIVVGYGTVRKSDLTGSVSVIKTDDIKDIPATRIDQMLQGRIAGAEIVSTSGAPGAGTSIRIRGTRSITAGNEPLYVVDGVIDGVKDLNELNPSDIQSMEVLKDASSTAIYGSRGANGVILITTRSGNEGRTKFTFRADVGFSQLPRYLDLMNAEEFATFRNDAYYFGHPNAPLEDYPHPNPASLGEGTNWTKEITHISPYQNYTLSGAGGSKSLKYYFSGNYTDNEGIIKNSGFKRIQGRLNVDKTFSKYAKAGIRINYSYVNDNINKAEVGTNTKWYKSTIFLSPLMPVYKENGSLNDWNTLWYGGRIFNSPVACSELIENTQLKKSLSTNMYLELTPVKGLKLKSTFSFFDYNRYDNSFEPSTLPERASKGIGSYARRRVWKHNDMLNENTASYNLTVKKKHKFDVLYGFTFQKKWNSDVSVSGDGFLIDDVKFNDLGALPSKENYSVYSSDGQQVMLSNLFRFNYNYASKYYVTFTGRADGSSNFADNHKWAFFPSGALKWNIKKENFMKNVKVINELSVRLSAGAAGNQGISNYRSLAELSSNSSGYIFDGSIPVGYYPSRIANPELTWEKTNSYNAGLDISFLKNRITLSIDYYQAYTRDLLLYVQIPAHTGFEERLTNIGKTSNKGIEFMINSNNITAKNFSWSTTLTLAHNSQMVDDIGGLDRVITYQNQWGPKYAMYAYEKGKPLNALYGMKYAGTWKNQAETDAEKAKPKGERKFVSISDARMEPGRQKYHDLNNDGILDNNDLTYLGDADPEVYGGIQNKFSLYGFDLNIYFSFSIGGKIYNPTEVFMGTGSDISNQYKYMINAWHPVRNPNSDIPRVDSQDNIPCDRFVYDASYLRLKSASVSYTFNLANSTRNLIRSLTLTAAGNNLFLWKKYNGYDPEVSTKSEGSTIRRMDNGAYPASRTIMFSAQVNF